MAEITSKNFEITWILGGWRFAIDQAGVKRAIKRGISDYDAPYVCVTRVNKKIIANFSKSEGYDFGATLAAELNYADYLYLDVRDEGIIYVRVKDNEVVEDRVILELEEGASTLEVFVNNLEYNAQLGDLSTYVIEVTGNLNSNIESSLTQLAHLGHSITRLERSKLDTLEPDENFRFEPESAALRKLTDKKAQLIMLASLIGCVMIGFAVYIFWPDPEQEVKVVTVDHWSQYRQLIYMNGISPIPRLSQDIDVINFLDSVPEWELSRVLHRQGGAPPLYVVHSDESGVIRNLRLRAKEKGYQLSHSQNGTLLTTSGVDIPPLHLNNTNSDVDRAGVVLPVAHQYEVVRDEINHITKNIFVSQPTVIDQPSSDGQVRWQSYRVKFVFTNAYFHDLYRLIAALSKVTSTLEQADLELRQSKLTGTYVIDIHGSI